VFKRIDVVLGAQAFGQELYGHPESGERRKGQYGKEVVHHL
jgi:hypothetical protein